MFIDKEEEENESVFYACKVKVTSGWTANAG
jgi:hypothetical protein